MTADIGANVVVSGSISFGIYLLKLHWLRKYSLEGVKRMSILSRRKIVLGMSISHVVTRPFFVLSSFIVICPDQGRGICKHSFEGHLEHNFPVLYGMLHGTIVPYAVFIALDSSLYPQSLSHKNPLTRTAQILKRNDGVATS